MTNGVELEFLDGKFVVPEHLALLMTGLDTTRYRYRAAVDLVNAGMLGQHLGKVQTDTIKTHFENLRREQGDGPPR